MAREVFKAKVPVLWLPIGASADVTSFWKRLLLDSGMSEAAPSIVSCFFSLKSSEGPSHFASRENVGLDRRANGRKVLLDPHLNTQIPPSKVLRS